MRKILVPCQMAQVATNAIIDLWDGKPSHWNPSTDKMTIAMAAVEAAISWLAENPVVPTDEQLQVLRKQWDDSENWSRKQGERGDFFRWHLIEWQRRMFLAPEPEVPEEVKELLMELGTGIPNESLREYNRCILEAYRRGKEAR